MIGGALSEVPRRPLEHLAAVPAQEGGPRLVFRPLRGPDDLAVVAQQGLLEAGGAVGLVGDQQHALGAEGEGAQVEVLWCSTQRARPLPSRRPPVQGRRWAGRGRTGPPTCHQRSRSRSVAGRELRPRLFFLTVGVRNGGMGRTAAAPRLAQPISGRPRRPSAGRPLLAPGPPPSGEIGRWQVSWAFGQVRVEMKAG